MYINQSALWKYLLEFIFQQLIHTSAAGYNDGFDIKVVQRIGNAMKQHPIVGCYLLTFLVIAG